MVISEQTAMEMNKADSTIALYLDADSLWSFVVDKDIKSTTVREIG